jgi:hypothetical protein
MQQKTIHSVKVPTAQYKKIKALAAKEGRSIQWCLARAIEIMMVGYPEVRP